MYSVPVSISRVSPALKGNATQLGTGGIIVIRQTPEDSGHIIHVEFDRY